MKPRYKRGEKPHALQTRVSRAHRCRSTDTSITNIARTHIIGPGIGSVEPGLPDIAITNVDIRVLSVRIPAICIVLPDGPDRERPTWGIELQGGVTPAPLKMCPDRSFPYERDRGGSFLGRPSFKSTPSFPSRLHFQKAYLKSGSLSPCVSLLHLLACPIIMLILFLTFLRLPLGFLPGL